MENNGAVAGGKCCMQSVPVPEGLRTLSQQQRAGVRVTRQIFCGAVSTQSQRRPQKGEDYAVGGLGYFLRLLRTTGNLIHLLLPVFNDTLTNRNFYNSSDVFYEMMSDRIYTFFALQVVDFIYVL